MMQRPITAPRLPATDMVLLAVFFIGIYLEVAIQITPTMPLPAAPSGLAGLVLLWRRRDSLRPLHLAGLLAVILLYILASLSVENYDYLGKRFTGLVQLSYSLIIGYAMMLTVIQASRRQLSAFFLTFSIAILIGSLLETHTGLRAISDQVRQAIYTSGVYESDLRDELLYGKIRPKVFTSEPSAVTFGYTMFTFAWFLVSMMRRKLLVFLALLGAGLMAMPGPTLLLSLPLLVPYYLFVVPKSPGSRQGFGQRAGILLLSMLLLIVFVVLGMTVYEERLNHILTGRDPSFFYRIIGPALVALEVMKLQPWAGAGLTGEDAIANLVLKVYVRSEHYSAAWKITDISTVLTNYFWLHWIYLGLVWGAVMLAAHSVWLRFLGVPSILFCWAVWVVFGQASGAYVGPKCWAIFFLAAGLSILHQRVSIPAASPLRPVTARLAKPPRGYLTPYPARTG